MGSSKDGKLRSGLHARFYRGVVLRTIYGRQRFSVMDAEPGSGVLVTLEKREISAGVRVKGNGILKEPHVIPWGSVMLRRANRHGHPFWAIYEAGAYSARRGVLHALAGYDETRVGGTNGEASENMKDMAALAEAEIFLHNWRDIGEAEREAVSEALLAFVGKHEDDLDPSKAMAADSVGSVADLRDRTGRRNPLIVRGQLSVAQRKLLERVGAIKGIDPKLALRYAVLDREIDLEIGVVRKVRATLTKLISFVKHDAILPADLQRKIVSCRNSLTLLKVSPFAEPSLVSTLALNTAAAIGGPVEVLREVEDTLMRLTAGHLLWEIVECLSVLPKDEEGLEARVARAKLLVKDFRRRNDVWLFLPIKNLRPSDVPQWYKGFRQGVSHLAENRYREAKESFDLTAVELVGR